MKKHIRNHLKRVLASRANGALSRGPVTPEGKRRASLNAVTHGLSAKSVLLPGESDERFQALLQGFQSDFAPQSHLAEFQVEQLAIAAWRMRRAQAFEASFVRDQLAGQPQDGDAQAHVARAWATSSAFQATRYETLHTRHFRLHLNHLIGGDVFPQPPAEENQLISCENTEMQNEPSPTEEHPQ